MKRKYSTNIGIIIVVLALIICVTATISKSVLDSLEVDNNSYVLRDLASGSIPVNNIIDNTISTPYNGENIKKLINYYDKEDNDETQSKSLILFESTYMPNTGIIYSSDVSFDIISIGDGEVIDIKEDEIFGKIIIIKHNDNLISKYSSLSEINVNKGDLVSRGEVLGKSGNNKVISESENLLLFELIYNDEYVNPDRYYGMNIEEMR